MNISYEYDMNIHMLYEYNILRNMIERSLGSI